jgi:hypothetical protein
LAPADGLLFAAGAVVLLARKGGSWSSLAILVTLLVPAVVLLGIGFLAPVDPPLPWRPAYLITGYLASRRASATSSRTPKPVPPRGA